MEKSGKEKQKQSSKAKKCSSSSTNIWDCGSTLYDSFELNSFKRQIDSAIANSPRTLSMPHLPESHLSLQPQPPSSNYKSFKFSHPFQKLLRFIFKSSNKFRISRSCSGRGNSFQVSEKYSKDRFYVVYDKSEAVLSTIPEVPEFEIGGLSPEISSLVRKSASERFTAPTTVGISCA
ncbi:uncharacterized protein LOC133284807 [Gastrolobium bilobum]|uniref:uncharacterized protein LOC133284807 n=1 Tax=Gastrolobium bilobum TaxID=150636 RepID=UPI002AB2BD99|nr:uncharacterized protein LOC133284807 [Gastrolobium bilobum]